MSTKFSKTSKIRNVLRTDMTNLISNFFKLLVAKAPNTLFKCCYFIAILLYCSTPYSYAVTLSLFCSTVQLNCPQLLSYMFNIPRRLAWNINIQIYKYTILKTSTETFRQDTEDRSQIWLCLVQPLEINYKDSSMIFFSYLPYPH